MIMYGKRKLIAFALGTISNSLLVALGKIEPGVYSVVAVALVGGFFTANVVSKLRVTPEAPA